ncbi:MAG: hypothetical protein ACI9GW_000748 [Halieaceae bacterium]|jgi:hypothetical protein
MKFNIRTATAEDLPEVLRVEMGWQEIARAEHDKFAARLEKFNQGFLLAVTQSTTPEVIGTMTSMPFRYNPENPEDFVSWDHVTNEGYLPDTVDISQCNALYIVSGIIAENYRGYDIFSPSITQVVRLARELKLRYVIAGAVIPGFRRYREKHAECSAWEYTSARRHHSPIDPLLNMYEKMGFKVPGEKYVVPDYFPDSDSLNYAAIVVHDADEF